MSTAYAKTAPRVLIVDDNPIQLDLLELILSRCEPRPAVTRATSGPEAMQMLRDAAWDLVVADYRMPRFSGSRVVEAARRGGAAAYLVSCDPRTASSAEVRATAHPKTALAELVPEWVRRVAGGGDDGRGKPRGPSGRRGARAGRRGGLSAVRELGRLLKASMHSPAPTGVGAAALPDGGR